MEAVTNHRAAPAMAAMAIGATCAFLCSTHAAYITGQNLRVGPEIRRKTRAAHLQFVAENEGMFRYGGALLEEQGRMIGSLPGTVANQLPALPSGALGPR